MAASSLRENNDTLFDLNNLYVVKITDICFTHKTLVLAGSKIQSNNKTWCRLYYTGFNCLLFLAGSEFSGRKRVMKSSSKQAHFSNGDFLVNSLYPGLIACFKVKELLEVKQCELSCTNFY